MKNVIIAVLMLTSINLVAQVDTSWTKKIQIDTIEIQFNLKVVGGERVIFTSNKPVPLTDRRWDWYFKLVRVVWTVEEARQKIEQLENR